MRVESPAGKFVLTFDAMEPGEGDELVIRGRMGVWEAKTYVPLHEFFAILRMTLRPRILGFLLRGLFRRRPRAAAPGAG